MHAPGIWGIIVVAIVVLLLFGRGKISSMMGEVASGIKAFQKGLRDEEKPKTLEASTTTVDARETEKAKDA
ncbi:MAG TPA: twin-arginine translocase TatA/TatE family subunit [Alphaproteobacteria bacterium]|nr:twin-arginine translocase TatA/TatE family subunit [Alphaproteobacteria bacterium]